MRSGDEEGTGDAPARRGRRMMTAMPAAGYERHLVPAIFGPWGRELLERVAPEPGERVVDIASATGTMD